MKKRTKKHKRRLRGLYHLFAVILTAVEIMVIILAININILVSIHLAINVSAWYCIIAIVIAAVEIHMIIVSRKETKNER